MKKYWLLSVIVVNGFFPGTYRAYVKKNSMEPRELQSNQWFISYQRANELFEQPSWKMSFYAKQNTLENIQTVHMLLCPQAFWAAILENYHFWLSAPEKYMGRIALEELRHRSYMRKKICQLTF